MPRPKKGYTEILYAYVTPEHRKFIEQLVKEAGASSSKSEVVNHIIETFKCYREVQLSGRKKKQKATA